MRLGYAKEKPEILDEVLGLWESGFTVHGIARRLEIDPRTARDLLRGLGIDTEESFLFSEQ